MTHSKITTVQTSQGELLAVGLTSDAQSIELHEDGKQYLTYHTGMGTDNYDILRETLPPGSYSLISSGLSSAIKEEEAATIVDEVGETHRFHGKIKNKYKHYQYGYQGLACNSSINSLRSLEQSLHLDPETTVWLRKEKV